MSGGTAVLQRGLPASKDYNHVSDADYEKYRKLADQAYGRRSSLAKQSQAAYQNGDKAKAKQLSNEAKSQMQEGDKWNAMAAEYVFVQNNKDSDENDIDLHGLYVREAEYILKQRIINGIYRHQDSLDCIVGKGLHSKGGIAKLKPAVQKLCNEGGFRWEIDPKNTGIMIIYIKNAVIPQNWSNINPNGIGAMVANQNVPDRRTGKLHPQQNGQQYGQQYGQQNYHQQQQQQQNVPPNKSNIVQICSWIGIISRLLSAII